MKASQIQKDMLSDVLNKARIKAGETRDPLFLAEHCRALSELELTAEAVAVGRRLVTIVEDDLKEEASQRRKEHEDFL